MPFSADDPVLIRLPRKAIEDISYLIEQKDLVLPVAQQSQVENTAASIDGFSIRVAAKLSQNAEVISNIATALWNLKNIQQGTGKTSTDLVDLISKSLQAQSITSRRREYSEKWPAFAPILISSLDLLTDDHPLLISAKANTLAYTQQNLCVKIRIIADMRPVFDTAGEKILETVVTNTMVVNYVDDMNQNRRMVISLDVQDIIALRKQCERAERKSQVIKDSLKDKGLNPVFLPEAVES